MNTSILAARLYLQKGVYAAATLISASLVARFFGPARFGQYSLFTTGLQLFLVLGVLGMNYRLIQERPRNPGASHKDYARTVLYVVCINSLIASLPLLGLLVLVVPQLRSMAWILIPASLLATMVSYFVSTNDQLEASIIDAVIRPLLMVALLLILPPVFPDHFAVVLNLAIGGSFTLSLIWALVRAGIVPKNLRVGFRYWRLGSMYTGAFAFTVMGVFTLFVSQFDRFVLAHLRGPSETGIYSAAQNVQNLIIYAATALTSILLPHVAQGMDGKLSVVSLEKACKNFARLLWIGSLAALCVGTIFRAWISALFGDGFASLSTPMLILLGGLSLGLAFGFPQTVLSLSEHRRLFVRIMMVWMGSSALLSVFLIHHFGMIGAAVANGIVGIGSRWSFYRAVKRKMGMDVSVFGRTGWGHVFRGIHEG